MRGFKSMAAKRFVVRLTRSEICSAFDPYGANMSRPIEGDYVTSATRLEHC
jgi:hypothetical protein